jgi:AAA+ superfamily predicted ATPase
MSQEIIRDLEKNERALTEQINETAEIIVKDNEGLSAKEVNEKIMEATLNFRELLGEARYKKRKFQSKERGLHFVR